MCDIYKNEPEKFYMRRCSWVEQVRPAIFVSKISTDGDFCFSKDIMPTNGFAQPFVGIISFLSMFHGADEGT